MYKNSDMTPRLSGHFSIFGLVFFVLKSLLGIAKQWSREQFAMLEFWYIERGLLEKRANSTRSFKFASWQKPTDIRLWQCIWYRLEYQDVEIKGDWGKATV